MSEEILVEDGAIWLRNMRQGNFDAAWQYSDKVLKARAGKPCWHWPRHFQYIWNGTPLDNKKVLVRCYHGLGDTIQFIRYAPLIKSIAKEVVVWAQARLIPLLQTVEGIDQLLPLHDGTPEVAYDVDVESMELPHIFRTTLATIPANIPYIQVDPLQLPMLEDNLAVGLVWKGGDWDEQRNIPFSVLTSLSAVPGVRFYILQADAEKAGWDGKMGVYACSNSLEEDARIIKSLDLLITADTMTAHLGGALGVPVWTMLQANADWRWMEQRTDSPWYPTMRLFRQEQPGNWVGVVARIKEALEQLVHHKRHASLVPGVLQ